MKGKSSNFIHKNNCKLTHEKNVTFGILSWVPFEVVTVS